MHIEKCKNLDFPIKLGIFEVFLQYFSQQLIDILSIINKKADPIYVNNSGWDNKNFELPDYLRKAGVGLLQYIPFESILEREIDSCGNFHIPEGKMLGLDHITVNYDLHFKNFRPFGVDLHDCVFNIRFKDEDFGRGTHCYETLIALFGEHGNIAFRFGEGGCEKYLAQRVGKKFQYGGSTEDMEHLIVEYKDYTTIGIKSTPDKVKFVVDDDERKVIDDKQQLGELRGIHLLFKGAPYIDYIELADNSGKVIFADYFDE